MPDERAAEVMAVIDAFDPDIRALVYEYGFMLVYWTLQDLKKRDRNAQALKLKLEEIRQNRQEQWLRTDYILNA